MSKLDTEILGYVIQGFNNKKIAEIMGISLINVKCSLNELYSKCNIKNRVQLAIICLKNNLV